MGAALGAGKGPKRHEVPSYMAMHWRVNKERGPAKLQSCVDCGEQAHDWSYNNSGVEEHTGYVDGYDKPLRYSIDIAQFDARCSACHRRFDAKAVADVGGVS